jgi:hypothetical protein
MKLRRSFFKTFVAPAIAGIAIIPTVLIAVSAVLKGRGADSYRSVYGLAIHYTSVLISIGVLLAAAATAYLARIIYFWRIGHDGAAKLHAIGHAEPTNED